MSIAPSHSTTELQYLEDRWDEKLAAGMDEPELLRYRSNLLGSDLRITNFGGGNTSSKVVMKDPLTGKNVSVLWVKGSGGDLGSIKRARASRRFAWRSCWRWNSSIAAQTAKTKWWSSIRSAPSSIP
jgi:hypothetical protein